MNVEPRTVGDTKQTPTSVAARTLGVSQARLAAVSTRLNRPAVAAVGSVLAGVLAEDADRLVAGGTAKGAPVWGIAETTGGDRAVPISAIVLVPAGVIADHEVVARIHQADWEAELEVFTTVDRLIGLRSAFRAWVVETTTHRVAVPLRPVHGRGRQQGHQPHPLGGGRGDPRRPAAARRTCGRRSTGTSTARSR